MSASNSEGIIRSSSEEKETFVPQRLNVVIPGAGGERTTDTTTLLVPTIIDLLHDVDNTQLKLDIFIILNNRETPININFLIDAIHSICLDFGCTSRVMLNFRPSFTAEYRSLPTNNHSITLLSQEPDDLNRGKLSALADFADFTKALAIDPSSLVLQLDAESRLTQSPSATDTNSSILAFFQQLFLNSQAKAISCVPANYFYNEDGTPITAASGHPNAKPLLFEINERGRDAGSISGAAILSDLIIFQEAIERIRDNNLPGASYEDALYRNYLLTKYGRSAYFCTNEVQVTNRLIPDNYIATLISWILNEVRSNEQLPSHINYYHKMCIYLYYALKLFASRTYETISHAESQKVQSLLQDYKDLLTFLLQLHKAFRYEKV